MLAQVLLTAMVSIWLYRTRVAEMRSKHIHPQKIATAADAASHLKAVAGPADNFSNLFEVPVLFYVAVLTLYVTQMVNALFLTLTVIYVALRYIHSFIHVTYNRVMHRFLAFVISTLLLWGLWILIGIELVRKSAAA